MGRTTDATTPSLHADALRSMRRHYRTARSRRIFGAYLRVLERAPWGDADAMDARRVSALQQMIRDIVPAVAFQRDRFADAGLDAESFRSIDALARLAPVGKQELRSQEPHRLVNSMSQDSAMWLSTSGSSGEPFRFAVDHHFHTRSDAVRAFVYRNGGVRPRVVVEMYAAPHDPGRRDPRISGFARYIIDYGLPVAQRAQRIAEIDPDVIYGNRSHLLDVADELERTGVRLDRVRCVISSSEHLGEADRSRIMEFYGAPCRDLYGLAEVSTIAVESAVDEPYVVIEPRVVAEVVVDGRPARAGELGELVVTSLDNHVMPFIRYATGDLARLSATSAPSGHAGMRIERVEGRLADTVRRSDGSLVPYWAFGTSVTWSHPSVAGIVRQWQVVLESRQRLVLKVIADGPLPDGARAHLVASMQDAIGTDVDVVVAEVTELEMEPNGKFKPVKVVG